MRILLEDPKSMHYVNIGLNLLIIFDILLIVYLALFNHSGDFTRFVFAYDFIVCILLLFDFFYRLMKTDGKAEYIRHNFLYFIAAIPLEFFLPAYFIAFRFILLIRLLNSAFFRKYFEELHQFLENTKFDKLLTWIMFTLIVFTIALYFLDPSMGLFDSLWYVVVTLTTVGYGDVVPNSFYSKVISLILLVLGIFIFSTLTGAISSYFNDKILNMDTDVEENLDIVEKKLDDLSLELGSVKEELELARAENRELHEKLDELLKK